MMIKSITSVVMTAFAMSLAPAFAHAAGHVSAVSVPTYNMPSSGNTGGNGLGGGGLLGEIKLSHHIGFETGALYETQVLNGTSSGNVSLPVGFRLWFGRFVTLSLGGYFDYQLNNVPSNVNALDYGARATGGFNIPLSGNIGLITEAGYRYGLANLAKGGGTFNQNQAMAIIGLRFGSMSM